MHILSAMRCNTFEDELAMTLWITLTTVDQAAIVTTGFRMSCKTDD